MKQTDTEQLKELIEQLLNPSIPVEVDLWSSKEIAAYLKQKPRTVAEVTCRIPGFPQTIYLPSATGKGRAHPRWKAREVIQWAEKYQENRVA